jgi:hypothetical protein
MPIVCSYEEQGLPPLIAGVDIRSPLEQQVTNLRHPCEREDMAMMMTTLRRTPLVAAVAPVR